MTPPRRAPRRLRTAPKKTTSAPKARRSRKEAGVSLDTVRRLVASLPETEEGPCYGTPGFRARRKLFARLREDGESLVVRVDPSERDLLLQADPHCFYITDHYRDHPWVLVRLPVVEADVLEDLLERAWCHVAPRRLLEAYEKRR
jgi:hypothetical protein